jgi:hypothetical protein
VAHALQFIRFERKLAMNTKAILATLFVVGSSTAALAQPVATVTPTNTNYTATVQMRDHRRLPVWGVLSSGDALANGRTSVKVSSLRQLSELRLTATRGTTEIDKIQIKFTDGKSEIVTPDQTINAKSPSLTVNLSSWERVKSITVLGHSGRRAQFEILGA